MKKAIFVMILTVLATVGVKNASAQNPNTPKKTKITVLESSASQLRIGVYGEKDSLEVRIIGTAKMKWDVNVRLFKTNAKKEKWFAEGDYQETCFKGRDSEYMWVVRFYNYGDEIELVQFKLGSMKIEDMYRGHYE